MAKRKHTKKAALSHSAPPAVVAIKSEEPAPVLRTSRRMHLLIATVMIVICAGLYSWTADFPLVFDDVIYMTENKLFMQARSLPYLTDFTAFATWPGKNWEDPDLALNIIMRPVAYLSLHLNHMLDGFQPRWFRVGNMALHAANGWLLYMLVMLAGRSLVEKGLLRAHSARFIAVGAALLFMVHPLATESVTYVIQRFTSMGTFFVLACVVLHLCSLDAERGSRRSWWRAAAVLCALLGMQTKEDAVTAPLLAVMLHWLVMGVGFRKALWSGLPLLLCLPLVPGLVWLTSAVVNDGDWSLSTAQNIVNFKNVPWSVATYFITQITVIAEYVRLLLWPSGQNVLPDPPVYDTLLNTNVLGCAAALACLPGIAWLVRRSQSGAGHGRLMLLSVAWFFGTIAVSSSLVPLPDMMAEHRTYLPSVGFFIFACALVDWLVQLGRLRENRVGMMRYGIMSTGLASLAVTTCQRNEVWRDDLSLWTDTASKSPGRFGPWLSLGAVQARNAQYEEALVSFSNSVERAPNLFLPRFNRVQVYASLERWQECIEECSKIATVTPRNDDDISVYALLGYASIRLGNYDGAQQWLRLVITHRPDYFMAHKLLGYVYHAQNQLQQAREHMRRANELNPGDPLVVEVLQACL